MKSKGIFGFTVVSLLWLASSCDTERNFEPQDYFVKYYGVDGDQSGVDMAVATDGSIYLLGNSMPSNNSDQQLYVVMANEHGILLWENRFGGTGLEEARDIEITADGNLAVVGNTTNAGGDRDFMVVLINSNDGSAISSRTDGYAGFDDDANSITEISNGFLVSGSTNKVSDSTGLDQRDAFVFRYHADLLTYDNNPDSWTTIHENSEFDVAVKAFEISPGLFYVFGNTRKDDTDQIPDDNVWVFPLGQTGVDINNFFVTNSLITGSPDPANNERLTSVMAVPGGGFLISGYSANSATQAVFVAKITDTRFETFPTTNQIFSVNPKIITPGLTPISDSKVSVFSLSSGFLVLSQENTIGNDDLYLTKLDNVLFNAWKEPNFFIFGGEGDDSPGAVAESPDGTILVFGTMVLGGVNGQKKMALIKVSPQGKFGE